LVHASIVSICTLLCQASAMGQTVSECKPCKVADPVTNTVTVDPTLLSSSPIHGQKAQQPMPEEDLIRQQKEKEMEEERRRLEGEQQEKERLQAEEEERLRRDAEEEAASKAAEEEARKQAEEQERRLKEEAERVEKAAQEERERAEAAERAKAEKARAAAAKERAEVEAAQKTMDQFLKAHGFKNMLIPRKAICGATVYPLHLAVEDGKVEAVRALLRCGADKEQKNSSKKTPLELAEKFNKNGSHDAIVDLLKKAK